MVHQKPVKFVTKANVRKNIKCKAGFDKNDNKENMKALAGPREVLALEALHTMFMKKLSHESNFLAFQQKKNIVDEKTMLAGAKKALEDCFSNENNEDSTSSEEEEEN